MNATMLAPSSDSGGPAAALFSDLYNELRRLARRELARRGHPMALGATTLLHEAYLGVSGRAGLMFPDRARFMAYASRAMRGLIIDHIRRQRADKRGGMFEITRLDTSAIGGLSDGHGLQQVSDALDELAAVDATLAEVVDLKFFCGFSFVEIGAMQGVSERTVQRHWEKARLYLHQAMTPAGPLEQAAVVHPR